VAAQVAGQAGGAALLQAAAEGEPMQQGAVSPATHTYFNWLLKWNLGCIQFT
jgi:hypothetical protein